jgi:hypothetical protein
MASSAISVDLMSFAIRKVFRRQFAALIQKIQVSGLDESYI